MKILILMFLALTLVLTPCLSYAKAPAAKNSAKVESAAKPDLFSSFTGGAGSKNLITIVIMLTILSFAPAILLLMSSFTRIVIVLSFLRQAMGIPQLPPNQIIVGLSLFLSLFNT